MARAWMRPALAALVIGVVAAPAFAHVSTPLGGGCRVIRGAETAEDPADDVSVCREDVYFHKANTPIGNTAATGQMALPYWDTYKPTASLDQAGIYVSSSEVDVAMEDSPAGRAMWQGSFTGTLDTLGLRLFLQSPYSEVVEGGDLPATLSLHIDGKEVFDNYDSPAIDVPLQPDDVFLHMDVAFVNLFDRMKALELDLSSTKKHTLRIGVAGWAIPARETVFVYDADEAKSGMFFNLEPESMTGFTKIDTAPPPPPPAE